MTKQCKCSHDMRDLGEWPSRDNRGLVHRWHCESCDEYHVEDVEGKKLIEISPGKFQTVVEA